MKEIGCVVTKYREKSLIQYTDSLESDTILGLLFIQVREVIPLGGMKSNPYPMHKGKKDSYSLPTKT